MSFTFGVKNNSLKIKDIMLENVDDKWYINDNYIDRFIEEPSNYNSSVSLIGFVLYESIVGNGETEGRHQDNKVYDSDGIAPTVLARVRPIMRVICDYREDMRYITYKGKKYAMRWLTPQECWRLQGIKDEYYFRVEKALNFYNSKLFERAGRAICIPMLKSIFSDFFKDEKFHNIKLFEAFSGIGSQRIALTELGIPYESVGTMEVDRYGIISYDAIHNFKDNSDYSIGKTDEEMIAEMRKLHVSYNFSSMQDEMPTKHCDIVSLYNANKRSKNFGDIRYVNINCLPNFDFFTYSFPCKNISIAGEMKGFEENSGTQSSLIWECLKIIKKKKPKYLMMENVKNICSKEYLPVLNKWIDTLSEEGYKSYWKVYNAVDFGVPQNRERVIMMSKLN